jgi:hypothetical protein
MVSSARPRLLRLSSLVAYRRRPKTCASELMVKVPCQSSVVDTKKPHSSAHQPPASHNTPAIASGATSQWRFSQRSSGNRARSGMADHCVVVYSRDKIQPMCAHHRPRARGECRSVSRSAWRWWTRWLPAHHSGPFCRHKVPPTASRHCIARPTLNVRWAK